jgi:hypothetical protein
LGRARLALFSRPSLPAVMCSVWFVAVFATIICVWGVNPVALATPDEALVRFAASVIGEHGTPFLKLPFADPEDLAHLRGWLSLGDTAIPTYAPVTLYAYGLLLRLRTTGLLLVAALPAAAAAAFAAGTERMLPPDRRWLALLAPVLGFPGLYWLLRPWMNLSALLVCLCWAFFFWASWRKYGSTRWLIAATLCVGAGAAVRPDYAAFLLLTSLLLTVAASPSQWRQALLLVTAAGAGALGVNLILNKAVTGHAFRAAYQMAIDREWGADDSHGLPGLGMLRVLLIPMGWPAPDVAAKAFVKYWLKMGPIALLLFGQLAIVPLLRGKPRVSWVLYVAATLLIVLFMFTRMHDELFGGAASEGFVHHSVPRYLSPAYLFAALPPILFLGHCRRGLPLVFGVALACALAGSGAYEICLHQPASLRFLNQCVHNDEALLQVLASEIPRDAMVYSVRHDKILWSRWRVGTIDQPEPSARSMNRAVAAGLPVFLLEPRFGGQSVRLASALRKKHLALVKVDAARGVYRVDPLL